MHSCFWQRPVAVTSRQLGADLEACPLSDSWSVPCAVTAASAVGGRKVLQAAAAAASAGESLLPLRAAASSPAFTTQLHIALPRPLLSENRGHYSQVRFRTRPSAWNATCFHHSPVLAFVCLLQVTTLGGGACRSIGARLGRSTFRRLLPGKGKALLHARPNSYYFQRDATMQACAILECGSMCQ